MSYRWGLAMTIMNTADLVWQDAAAQAKLVREGTVGPDRLVRAVRDQVDRWDDRVNSLVSSRFESALTEALDVATDAPFRGVPIVVKDQGFAMAGEPLWYGNRVLRRRDHRAAVDSALVTSLRTAGFVVVGRTNTAEFGATITTEPAAAGSCRNPWDFSMSTGGSSGGSAAAVAAGFSPVALGTDASGSVRIPASACGVIGLKPTNGTIRLDPEDRGGWFGLATPGIFARSVRDARALLRALPTDLESPGVAPAVDARSSWADARCAPLTVAVVPGSACDDLAADSLIALTAVKTALRHLGHSVVEELPPFLTEPGFHRQFLNLAAAGLASDIGTWERRLSTSIYPDELDPTTRAIARLGVSASGTNIADAYGWLHNYRMRANRWWESGVDVLVTPVLASGQIPLGWFSDPVRGPGRVRHAMRFTAQFNVCGNPAMSLPLYETSAGLPLGLQFVAATRREDVLLDLARDLEREMRWHERRPRELPPESS